MLRALVLLPLLVLLLAPLAATAQPATAPQIAAADQAFDRGLRSFRAGDYAAAHDAFSRSATGYEFHQRTTAAQLMAGKALLAAGEFDAAISSMTTFVASYPRSRYVEEARRIRRAATEARDAPAGPERAVLNLGVALPLGSGDDVFSQSLFNGIRLAVDAHNVENPGTPVRLIFRDSGGESVRAADAISALARAGAHVVIGPLYSEEAVAAGGVAERERLPLITPLATDERVSDGRRHVFQANPTFNVRGRTMARYARDAGLDRVGVVAVRGALAETEANAFLDEAVRLGLDVAFSERLPSGEAWFQLVERVGDVRLADVDAVYFPVSGSGADDQAAAALRGMDQVYDAHAIRPRVLGNTEWQGLDAAGAASRYGAVFVNDFFPLSGGAELSAFRSRYEQLAGVAPDRLAYAGYDVARLILHTIRQPGGDAAAALRSAPPFNGLAHRIDFGGDQVNQALFLLQFREGRLERVQQ